MSLAIAVGQLARKIMATEEAEREAARLAYPKLLESNATDAKSIEQMQRVMALLGKTAADLSQDANVLREYRRLQGLVREASGLEKQRQAAAQAVVAHAEETKRIIDQRRQDFYQIQQQQNALEGRHSQGQDAQHRLVGLHEKHRDLLVNEKPIGVDDPTSEPASKTAAA